jgi:hypothetical protein
VRLANFAASTGARSHRKGTVVEFCLLFRYTIDQPAHDVEDPYPMSTATTDPWFQSLFAERIGGAGYGKGTEIYKFEKI